MLDFLTSQLGITIVTLLLVIVLIAIAVILVKNLIKLIFSYAEDLSEQKRKLSLEDVEEESTYKKSKYMRQIVAPDAVDTAPNGYLIINEGGRQIYVRNFTITKLPKNVRFANTFVELMDFPNCSSSVRVVPISEATMSKKINQHITVIDSEYIGAAGNPNRQRQLRQQYEESQLWARELEVGENKFFNVGFVFSLYGSSLSDLNNQSDIFRKLAVGKNIEITSCYALQAEAYLANAPFNMNSEKMCGVNYIMMDKKSVSTIYNYTTSTFSHRTGVPIGRDLFSGKPIIFDVYNHKSFIGAFLGAPGLGKSASIKMLIGRASLQNYRFAVVDSQTLKGTNGGEYSPIARTLNGIVFQLSSDTDNVLNLFDVRASRTFQRDKHDTLAGTEIDWLELNQKISLAVDSLLTIIQNNKEISQAEMAIRMEKLITDCTKQIYALRGIVHGDPDSLYEYDSNMEDGLTSGVSLKEMPTLTDFYKEMLKMRNFNEDESLLPVFNLIIDGLADYVRGVYYCVVDGSVKFFTKEEFYSLEMSETSRAVRKWGGFDVIGVEGTSPYFDGQSTINAGDKCPFISIDISQLPEGSKKITARQVAISWINECCIAKNSESMDSADKLLVVLDEAHENFSYEFGRRAIEKVCRTARKKNVSLFLATQTVSEFNDYKETQKILNLCSFFFIFAQPYAERAVLKEKFGFTDSQIHYITNYIGGNSQASSEQTDDEKHRITASRLGEVALFDKEQKRVAFMQFKYFERNEKAIATSKAEEILSIYKVQKR